MNVFMRIALFCCAIAILFLCACSNPGSSETSGFSDNFDSYGTANPWTPAGGWISSHVNAWAIVNPGISGNGLQFVGSWGYLTSSFTGTDYTMSVRVRPVAAVDGNEFGIFSRRDANGYQYTLFMGYVSGNTRIAIYKYRSGGDSAVTTRTYLSGVRPDADTYYTMTLQASGSTITGTVTDGPNTRTVTYVDDGTTNGVVNASGSAGLYSGTNHSLIYDNFTIIEP